VQNTYMGIIRERQMTSVEIVARRSSQGLHPITSLIGSCPVRRNELAHRR